MAWAMEPLYIYYELYTNIYILPRPVSIILYIFIIPLAQ